MPTCPTCRYYSECMKCFQEIPESGCGNYQQDCVKPKKPPKAATICWDCTKLDCSWMKSLEPVAGWDAEKTYHTDKVNGKMKDWLSYCVKSCPGYIPAKKEKRRKFND